MPDVTAVVANRAIRRESADPGAVEDGHAQSSRVWSRYDFADAILALDVALVVRQEHVVVAREQRLDQRPEPLAVAVREMAAGDQIDRLAQIAVAVVHTTRVVAVRLGLRLPPRPSGRRGRSSRRPPPRGSRRSRRPACRWSARRSSRTSCCRCRTPPCRRWRSARTGRPPGRRGCAVLHVEVRQEHDLQEFATPSESRLITVRRRRESA